MVELVDTRDLKSLALWRASSNLAVGTIFYGDVTMMNATKFSDAIVKYYRDLLPS